MFYPTPESGARKIWRQIVWQTLQKPAPVFWRRFLAPVSGPCVRGIRSVLIKLSRVFCCCSCTHCNKTLLVCTLSTVKHKVLEFFSCCRPCWMGPVAHVRRLSAIETQFWITAVHMARVPAHRLWLLIAMDPKTTTTELGSTSVTDLLWTYYAIFGRLT